MAIELSIVIPTLNEEQYLSRCLSSISQQSYRNFEVIFVDGGSKDKTVANTHEWLRKGKQQGKVITVKNSNVCSARDIGLRIARGKIIVGVDADTIYPNNYFQHVADSYRKNPHAIAVVGPGILTQAPLWAMLFWKTIYTLIILLYRLTGFVMYAPAFNLSYIKDAFLALGGYNTRLDFGGDELDVLERLKKAGKVVYLPDLVPTTSGRRYRVGIFRFFFKHMLYYYWLNYILRKYFGIQIIRAKPVR